MMIYVNGKIKCRIMTNLNVDFPTFFDVLQLPQKGGCNNDK